MRQGAGRRAWACPAPVRMPDLYKALLCFPDAPFITLELTIPLHAAGRWEARVGVPSTRTRPSGRHVYLGLFRSEAGAAKARPNGLRCRADWLLKSDHHTFLVCDSALTLPVSYHLVPSGLSRRQHVIVFGAQWRW